MCSFGGISVCRTSEGRRWAALTVCSLQFPCQWWCKGEDIFRLGCWWAQWIFASDDVWPQGFFMDSYLWYVELLSAFLGCLVCIMVWENLDDSLRSKSSDSSHKLVSQKSFSIQFNQWPPLQKNNKKFTKDEDEQCSHGELKEKDFKQRARSCP